MSSQSHSQMESRPGTAQSTGGSAPRAHLLQCNRCWEPLVATKTCFWCSCDCIFCEECCYEHFKTSADCPTCGVILKESDFTELVVTDATSATSDVLKTSMQALFTKQSSVQALSFSDLCHSLIRELDNSKKHTRFLLKQLLRQSNVNVNGRQLNQAIHTIDVLKKENTQLKQAISTERLQNDKALTDLQHRLQAQETANAELQHKVLLQEKMVNQFRQQGRGQVSRTGTPRKPPGVVNQPSCFARRLQQEPPLKGFSMHKEAQPFHQGGDSAQALRIGTPVPSKGILERGGPPPAAQRTPSVLGRPEHQQLASTRGHSLKRSYSAADRQPIVTPVQLGSIPNTPRIRDLSPRTGYASTSTFGSWQGGTHLNKRRRGLGDNQYFNH